MVADTVLIGLLVLVALMTVGIYLKTGEQAQALRALDQAAKDWLAMQVRRERRQAEGLTFDRENALRWLSDLIGRQVADVGQVYEDFQAVEVLLNGEERRTALVTAFPEDEFRRRVKQARKTGRLEARVAPVLPRRARVFSRGLAPDWVYFDLEAEAVGRALGVNWGSPGRLWVWR